MNVLNGTCYLQACFACGSFAAALLCTYEIELAVMIVIQSISVS